MLTFHETWADQRAGREQPNEMKQRQMRGPGPQQAGSQFAGKAEEAQPV